MEATSDKTTAGTRERILHATSRLLDRHGYEGAGVKQIAREAEASLGSVYHFFPGGKADLAAEALCVSGREFADLLRAALDGEREPAKAVAACARAVAASLRASDWIGGCTFTGTAVESAESAPQVHRAIAEAIEQWQEIVAEKLRSGGLSRPVARDLACTAIAMIGGAALASQIARDDQPLHLAGRHLARLVSSYR